LFIYQVATYVNWDSYIVASYLKVLIPVGTTVIIVANIKYTRVTPAIPTLNIWCAHDTSPSNPIAVMAKTVTRYKLFCISLYYVVCTTAI
jgi:hypothetical protein